MRIVIVGPGRAGGAIAIAASDAGHSIEAIVARRSDDLDLATRFGLPVLALGAAMPSADLLVVAVRDDALGDVAVLLSEVAEGVPAAVHLSGLAPVSVLKPLAQHGIAIGAFHPLQTLPDAERGADALDGSSIAVTAEPELATLLAEFARSLGAASFEISDDRKPLYHAAAAASANYVIAALGLAQDLFAAADLDAAVARPLVEAVVANAFELGASTALTGPIARGDVGTVESQIHAVQAVAPHLVESFKAFGRETALRAGTDQLMAELLR